MVREEAIRRGGIIMHIAWVPESGGRRRHGQWEPVCWNEGSWTCSRSDAIRVKAALSQYQCISDPYIVPIRGAIPHLPDLYYHNITLACTANHFI